MPRQDTTDFLAAFAVGTVLGIGATLLLQPRPTPRQKVAKQLKPYRKQMKRSYTQARGAVRGGAGATVDLSGEVVAAGRELLDDFRTEVANILGEARAEMQEMVGVQPSNDLSRRFRRGRAKLGL